jgi:hypothetical protein
MWTKEFWRAAADRAIRTAAQALLIICGTAVVLQDVDWAVTLSEVALLTLSSVLTSIALPPTEVKLAGELAEAKGKHERGAE